MRQGIIDRRRKEGWRIALWCERKSVVCQITTPDPDEAGGGPDVDVACLDLSSAMRFAREVCRQTPDAVTKASTLVFNWRNTTPEIFLTLLRMSKGK